MRMEGIVSIPIGTTGFHDSGSFTNGGNGRTEQASIPQPHDVHLADCRNAAPQNESIGDNHKFSKDGYA